MKEKTLDEQLEYLKGLGVKEINKATKLATNKIEDILQKHFDKIDNVRAKGFITMLEREYGLDLSLWLKEYALYHNKIPQPSEDIESKVGSVADIDIKQKAQAPKVSKEISTAIQALKLPEKNQQEKPTYTHTTNDVQRNNVINIVFFVFLCAIVVACVGYFGYKIFGGQTTSSITTTYKPDTPKSQAPEIVVAQDQEIAQPQDTSASQDSQVLETEGELESAPTESNATNSQDLPQQASTNAQTDYDGIYIDFNALPQNPQTQVSESPLPQQEVLQAPQALPQHLPRLTIIPNSTLWIGVVDLQSKKTSQLNISAPYDIELDRRYVFVFGHSDFESTIDNQTFPHKTKNFVRFYFDGKELKEIGYGTYRQLNPQDNWQ